MKPPKPIITDKSKEEIAKWRTAADDAISKSPIRDLHSEMKDYSIEDQILLFGFSLIELDDPAHVAFLWHDLENK